MFNLIIIDQRRSLQILDDLIGAAPYKGGLTLLYIRARMYVKEKSMRRTKEDAELTRQALLKAAIIVFSHQGYAATRLEDIAEAAKVTRGAVYHHFGGKAELFAEIIETADQMGDRALQRAIQEGGTFLEVLQRILVYTVQMLNDDSQYRASMALLLFNWDSPDLNFIRESRLEHGLAALDQVVGYFRAAVAEGAVRADLDPEIAARAFMAYQNGLHMLALASPGTLDTEKHGKGMAEIFVQGIAPR
jgi:TetR/AcrR family acrAB operon transcriptional repressor